MIILCGSEKGGTGKTTVATNLAVALAHHGRDVLVVDADRQASAAAWYAERQGRSPRVHLVERHGDLFEPVRDLRGRYQDVIIDAGGRDSVELRSSLLVADVLVCPLRASQLDLWTAGHVAELVERARAMHRTLVALAVLNLCPTHAWASEPAAAEAMLVDLATFRVAEARLHDRKAYRDAACLGLGVIEHTDRKAAAEIQALTDEVATHAGVQLEAQAAVAL